jgi:hypothetical protein
MHALARDAEILRGAGKTFPRTWQSLEILICRTFGTLSGTRQTIHCGSAAILCQPKTKNSKLKTLYSMVS